MVVTSVDEAVGGSVQVLEDDVLARRVHDRVLLGVEAHMRSFPSSGGWVGTEDLLLVGRVEEAVSAHILASRHGRECCRLWDTG